MLDEDGQTKRQRNESFGVEEKSPELIQPEGCEITMDHFMQLHSRRAQGMDGPLPISDQQVVNWLALTGEKLTREDVRCLFAMDSEYMQQVEKFKRNQEKKRQSKNGTN